MGIKDFQFYFPTRVIFGANSREKIKDQLEKFQVKKVLLVTDKGLVNAGVVAKIEEVLAKCQGVECCIYDGVVENPLDSTIDQGYEFAQNVGAELIIGLGGGSSLDTATGIAMLCTNGGKTIEYFKGKAVANNSLPTILIPTTAGTGSEVNRCFVATDPTSHFKDGIAEDQMCPNVAILDPELTVTLPPHITAATGMDAFTHACEAFLGKSAHPLSDALNLHAMKLIAENIRKAVAVPADIEARSNMLLGSAIAGIGFDQVGLVLGHAMAHPLSGLFNVPHGVACAVVLPAVLEYNVIACPEKLIEIAKILGEPLGDGSLIDQARAAVTGFKKLMVDIGVPTTISQLGITEKDIPKLAEDTFASKGMRSRNPRVNDLEDIENLYKTLL